MDDLLHIHHHLLELAPFVSVASPSFSCSPSPSIVNGIWNENNPDHPFYASSSLSVAFYRNPARNHSVPSHIQCGARMFLLTDNKGAITENIPHAM